VEKAVRFRAQQKDVTVAVKSESIEQKSEMPISSVEPFSLKLRSSNQLEELGGGNSRYAIAWSGPRNATQLQELGPRYKWWNVTQLKELGPRYKWWNATQLQELGGNTHRGIGF